LQISRSNAVVKSITLSPSSFLSLAPQPMNPLNAFCATPYMSIQVTAHNYSLLFGYAVKVMVQMLSEFYHFFFLAANLRSIRTHYIDHFTNAYPDTHQFVAPFIHTYYTIFSDLLKQQSQCRSFQFHLLQYTATCSRLLTLLPCFILPLALTGSRTFFFPSGLLFLFLFHSSAQHLVNLL